MMASCNICGNAEFKPAPFGRFSSSGQPPVCTKCGSLERHRICRSIIGTIRDPSFKSKVCLQFSVDPSVASGWFERHELSRYGGPDSIDVQHIDRPDESIDVVVCNHVLEHVKDDRLAIQNLVRINKPDGFVFLSFPNPYRRAVTEDWGYPKREQHNHYRVFGRDIERIFEGIIPHVHVIWVEGTDPATQEIDGAYILTSSDKWLARIFERGVKGRICQIRRRGEN